MKRNIYFCRQMMCVSANLWVGGSVCLHCPSCNQDCTLLLCRCGSAEGLDAGRHCLQQWGFRRCEDICWIKTNKKQRRAASVRQDTQAVLQHTKVPPTSSICMHFAALQPLSVGMADVYSQAAYSCLHGAHTCSALICMTVVQATVIESYLSVV